MVSPGVTTWVGRLKLECQVICVTRCCAVPAASVSVVGRPRELLTKVVLLPFQSVWLA
jgi:hypothetical protein